MKKTLKSFVAIILVVLCFASLYACTPAETPKNEETTNETTTQNGVQLPPLWEKAVYTEDKEFGEGNKTLSVKVVAGEKTGVFTVKTDKETVGEALIEYNLIDGEDGDYGLYIKSVNSITADYSVDQSYWAFYIGDEYAPTGVDMTDIEEGADYRLVYTKE